MDKDFIIREYREGDEVSILKLRGLVLSGSKSIDWWMWQHRQNPAGPAIITVAQSEYGSGIIGHECVVPLRIKVGENTSLSGTSIDNMVHPDYRGLGVYKQIRQKVDELVKQGNIQFLYTFTNQVAYYINLKIGSRSLFKKTPLWVKPLRMENNVSRYLGGNGIPSWLLTVTGRGFIKFTTRSENYKVRTQVKEIKEVDERFDSLWEQASSHHKIMMVRDRAYLDWRYIKRPDANYTIYISEQGNQLLGYIVVRIIEDNGLQIGWITDILTSSKETPASTDLIWRAIQYFRSNEVDLVLCTLPSRAYLAHSLRRQGFLFASRWQKAISAVTVKLITPKYDESFITNPHSWYITRGDTDLI